MKPSDGALAVEVQAEGSPLEFALSPQQRRAFLEKAAEVYLGCAVQVPAGLSPEAVRHHAARVLARHEILRTVFPVPAGRELPLQRVETELLPAEVAVSAGAGDPAALLELLCAEPWRATEAGGTRWALAAAGARGSVLLLAAPRARVDRRGLRSVAEAILRAAAGESGEEPEPLQYGDYTDWVHEQRRGTDRLEARRFWESAARAEPGEEREPDGGRLEPASTTWARAELPAALQEQLHARASAWQLSEESLALAAWAHAASALLGSGMPLVGVATRGRALPELQGSVGPYDDWLPLLLEVASASSFEALARSVAARTAALSHWGVHFSPQRWTETRAAAGAAPEVLFSYLERSTLTLLAEREPLPDHALTLELAAEGRVTLHRRGGTVPGELSEILARFLATLADGLARPAAPLESLARLGSAERERILVLARGTPLPTEKPSVLELFAASAAAAPSAVAVRHGGHSLTYAELDARANALAVRLAALGVGPEVQVPLLGRRDLQLPVAILGILKAGGAYVPIDPAYPAERIRFITRDCAAKVVVTDGPLPEGLFDAHVPAVDLAQMEAAPTGAAPPTLPPVVHPAQLAYVIYTSGSTGKPKAVQVSHGNLAASTLARRALYPRVEAGLLLYSFAFDSSVSMIFPTLVDGGTLVIAAEAEARDPAAIGALVEGSKVTHVSCNPNLWSLVLEQVSAAQLRTLRVCMVAGEACPAPLVGKTLRQLPAALLVNEYGPTEATVWSTAHRAELADADGVRVPIGKPISGASAYVLDAQQRLCPLGVAGELYLGGPGISRGYRSPVQTAERFLPDPFGPVAGARLYRTGDRVRLRPDGALEFLGRTDGQVKLRGYRIELGEIESTLLRVAPVREAAVVVRDEGGARLVCFYVPTQSPGPSELELRQALAGALPEYMVPALWVPLERLARNVHGKVDLAALPAQVNTAARTGPSAAPQTARERTLLQLFEEVLGRSGLGVDDGFFEQGGDSIRAIQLRSRAAQAGLKFELGRFLEAPNVRQLAAISEEVGGEPAARTEPFALLTAAQRGALEPLGHELVDAYPMTRLQAGMLFHNAMSGDGGAYQDLSSFHLRGKLEVDTLRRALAWLVDKHPVLRTGLAVRADAQWVARSVPVELAVVELLGLEPAAQEAELEAFHHAERHRPFDLANPPLVRFTVHRRSAETFQLTWVAHHAILDGWSNAQMTAELLSAYRSLLSGQSLPSPLPDAGFRDYVALERQALGSAAARSFWSGRLEGASPPSLTTRTPLTPTEEPEGAALHHQLFTRELSEALQALAAQEAVSLKSVLLAAHLKVLATLVGSPRVVSGVVTNGRPEEGGDRVLGLFLNVLPVQEDVGRGSFRRLVRAAHAAEVGWTEHRRYPLAQIQRDEGRPVLDTLFNYTHFHVLEGAQEASGFEVLGSRFRDEHSFALSAMFRRELGAEAGLGLRLHYRTGIFTEPEVAELARWYQRVLEALAFAPDTSMENFSLLSEEGRQELQMELNHTERDYPVETLGSLVAKQVAASPERTAIHFDGAAGSAATLSYRELGALAARVRQGLGEAGVGAEDRVGVFLERSERWLAAVLGVLESGGVYLPLDVGVPAERTEAVLADADARFVIVDAHSRAQLPRFSGRVLLLEDLLASAAPRGPAPELHPDQLAYVIYTSGSTGQPKGVAVSHRAICNHLAWRQETFPLGPERKMLHKAAAVFDIAVWEMFAPLVAGATLVIAAPGGQRDVAYLAQLASAQRVTDLHFHPAALALFLEETGSARCEALQRVFVGGEALSVPLALRFQQRFPQAELVHQYGPTETTVDATAWPVGKNLWTVVPIGKPIANTQAYVLDAALQPVPLGAPGELYLGGVGLARGYIRAPRATAERFLPSPFGPPGARLYRTGDQVRQLPGGAIVFLGRQDHQVKIRGYRVELGEVEAQLLHHPRVLSAVAVAQESADGVKRLHAFVVARPGGEFSEEAVRAFLLARAPEYVVPQFIHRLDALPTTATGKPDRAALAELAKRGTGIAAKGRPPAGELELEVARIFCELLQRPEVGADQDFFELGGDSLVATRAVARLCERFSRELLIRDFFDAPTVAGVAALLEQAAASTPAESDSEAEELLARLEDLSPEEIDALLKAREATS